MLSKAQIKYIRSLSQHKIRNENKAFVLEGTKIVHEWLNSLSAIQMIVATDEWVENNFHLISKHHEATLYIVSEEILDSISTLQTPNQVLIVALIPIYEEPVIENKWYIALDNIQDPGNMGTIIRIADWFGIDSIFCTLNCVDTYNPKVVQAAMGSHLRVKTFEKLLVPFLNSLQIPIIVATLDGESVYNFKPIKSGIIIIGNESKGISNAVLSLATHNVTIPKKGGAESLNAGVSAGILCAILTGNS